MTNPDAGAKLALRRLARRIQHLAMEIREADLDLKLIMQEMAPELLDQFGVGPSPPRSCSSPPATTPNESANGSILFQRDRYGAP